MSDDTLLPFTVIYVPVTGSQTMQVAPECRQAGLPIDRVRLPAGSSLIRIEWRGREPITVNRRTDTASPVVEAVTSLPVSQTVAQRTAVAIIADRTPTLLTVWMDAAPSGATTSALQTVSVTVYPTPLATS